MRKIKFDPGKTKPMDLSQISDSISFKILVDDKGYEIGDYEEVFLVDSLIIIPQKAKGKILMFDLDGNPKRKLELLTPGPGQILNMSDVYLNRDKRVLEVLDKQITKIFAYDLTGKFIEEVPIKDFKKTGFQFASASDLYVFERISTKRTNDRLGIFDSHLKHIQSSLKIPDPILKMNYVRQHALEVYRDSVFYLPLLENKIYHVDETGAHVAYEFDLPDAYKISDDFLKNEKFDALGIFLEEMQRSKLIVNTDHLYLTDDLIYFYYKTEKEWKNLLYSKRSQKVIGYTHLKVDAPSELTLTAAVVGTDGTHFAYLVHPSNNAKLPENIKRKLGPNGNPVLLYFKFKKF
ncbi:MAG: 6-bladed beta-propeller [Bacteroidota bacterium]